MSLVRRGQAARQGIEIDEEDEARKVAAAEEIQERGSLALYASGAITDDGILDPRDTRTALAICLSVCRNTEIVGAGAPGGDGYGVFRL
jgi:acetyl-CoA carboxylase carboxyltransferase component